LWWTLLLVLVETTKPFRWHYWWLLEHTENEVRMRLTPGPSPVSSTWLSDGVVDDPWRIHAIAGDAFSNTTKNPFSNHWSQIHDQLSLSPPRSAVDLAWLPIVVVVIKVNNITDDYVRLLAGNSESGRVMRDVPKWENNQQMTLERFNPSIIA
jgi:hypothetical protein